MDKEIQSFQFIFTGQQYFQKGKTYILYDRLGLKNVIATSFLSITVKLDWKLVR